MSSRPDEPPPEPDRPGTPIPAELAQEEEARASEDSMAEEPDLPV